ncbi:hypothetical protein LZ554_005661 [Drepanopeziza brunnea f. sp. 'monogermtubi']|nr:hypothetical protein LZ554_005661 [Drepanopeziza brunnea f. sp. 'monogermtubi']
MPSFLDLPREIRDEIYNYVLFSPSGLVTPTFTPHYATLKSRRRNITAKTKLHLITNPHDARNGDALIPRSQTRRSWKDKDTRMSISLALPSTCRQIYHETHGLFWDNNTFYFDGLHESGRGLGVVRTLKLMGQTASRLVQRVTIRMTSSYAEISALRKVLHTLSSRARLGHFRTLELVWEDVEFGELLNSYMESLAELVLFDTVMQDLKVGGGGGEWFERVVRVPRRPEEEADRDAFDEVVSQMHFAFGGKMVCGGVVRWENHVMV